MSGTDTHARGLLCKLLAAVVIILVLGATLGVVFLTSVFASPPSSGACSSTGAPGGISLLAPGGGERVAATLYGGPGDPVSGSVGSSGVNLYQHPDSYAELGGTTFETATALGGLPYETPLRITFGRHSVIAYKRDIGFGGPPVDRLPRGIDPGVGLRE